MMNDFQEKNKVVNVKGRKKDKIWENFISENGKMRCNIENCKKTFSDNTSLTTLKQHVSKYHEKLLENKSEEKVNKINLEETKMEEISEKEIYKAFAIAFAKNSLPYSLLENKHFKTAINLYKRTSETNLTKYKMKKETQEIGEQVREEIITKLSSEKSPVTLAIDGWTNVRSNKVTNLLLISNGTSYFYSCIENNNNKNNAEWLSTQLEIKIKELIEKKINIIALTTDNENLMRLVRKILQEKFPILIDVPCSAHLMQLCLKNICEIPGPFGAFAKAKLASSQIRIFK